MKASNGLGLRLDSGEEIDQGRLEARQRLGVAERRGARLRAAVGGNDERKKVRHLCRQLLGVDGLARVDDEAGLARSGLDGGRSHRGELANLGISPPLPGLRDSVALVDVEWDRVVESVADRDEQRRQRDGEHADVPGVARRHVLVDAGEVGIDLPKRAGPVLGVARIGDAVEIDRLPDAVRVGQVAGGPAGVLHDRDRCVGNRHDARGAANIRGCPDDGGALGISQTGGELYECLVRGLELEEVLLRVQGIGEPPLIRTAVLIWAQEDQVADLVALAETD
ncbi:MAG: hypothetical protein R2701_00445 [Acidimicrobiales bacterium]